MTAEIKNYFMEQCIKYDLWTTHVPEFQTKQQVDQWFNKIIKVVSK
jgi:hypothetical protein